MRVTNRCPDHHYEGGYKLKNGNFLYICPVCGEHLEVSALEIESFKKLMGKK